jgi:hypothetical protein
MWSRRRHLSYYQSILDLTTLPLAPRLRGQILSPNQNVFVYTSSKNTCHLAMSGKKFNIENITIDYTSSIKWPDI